MFRAMPSGSIDPEARPRSPWLRAISFAARAVAWLLAAIWLLWAAGALWFDLPASWPSGALAIAYLVTTVATGDLLQNLICPFSRWLPEGMLPKVP